MLTEIRPLAYIYGRSISENKGEICHLLIRNGADPLWRNSQGENPAHVHMHSFVEDHQVQRCAREQVEDEFLSGKDMQRTLEFLRKMEESILMEDQIEQ